MIRVRYRDSNELSPGLHAAAERHGRITTVYLLPGLTKTERRSALRRLRLSARLGHCPRLPSGQLPLALIAARALQGIGGALLTPGSLAILQASFAEDDRMAAIGAWSGLGGVATAIGPFLGGWLIDAVSWRLVFFINLPLAVAVVAIAARHVPETRAPGPVPKLDVKGALCISGALAGITYGLIAASANSWGSVPVLAPLAAGVLLLGLFVLVEAREPEPMLPLGVFRS